MGGVNSGGHNRLSDEEKKRRGTLDPRWTEAAIAERKGAKVITGPWLSEIPKSDLPLGDVGLKKYQELTQSLFDMGKLTLSTKILAEQVAVLHEQMHRRMAEGRVVPVGMSSKIQQAVLQLGIAENAPTIAAPSKAAGKFTFSGFSNRRPTKD